MNDCGLNEIESHISLNVYDCGLNGIESHISLNEYDCGLNVCALNEGGGDLRDSLRARLRTTRKATGTVAISTSSH